MYQPAPNRHHREWSGYYAFKKIRVWCLIVAIGVIFGVMTQIPSKNVTYKVSEKPSSNSLSKDEIKNYIIQRSKESGINPELSLCIVKHESQFQGDRIGDTDFKGVSLGWWQINTWYNPTITKEFAFDLASSTDWSLKQLKAGHRKWWSTNNLYCSHIPLQ